MSKCVLQITEHFTKCFARYIATGKDCRRENRNTFTGAYRVKIVEIIYFFFFFNKILGPEKIIFFINKIYFHFFSHVSYSKLSDQ